MQNEISLVAEEEVKAYNVFLNQKQSHFYLKSFNKKLNQFLEGGLHTGIITQIFGESGSGKTQMAMIFSIAVSFRLSRPFTQDPLLDTWQRKSRCIGAGSQNSPIRT